jgi:hypothetical protein
VKGADPAVEVGYVTGVLLKGFLFEKVRQVNVGQGLQVLQDLSFPTDCFFGVVKIILFEGEALHRQQVQVLLQELPLAIAVPSANLGDGYHPASLPAVNRQY